MDPVQAITTIEKHDIIGLLLPDEPSIDAKAGAEVLLSALGHMGKTVGLLAPTSVIADPGYFEALARTKPLAREFIISVNTEDSPVRQLRYEQNERAIDIIVTPKSNPLSSGAVSFRDGALRCDLAIAIGFSPESPPEKQSNALPADFLKQTPFITVSPAQNSPVPQPGLTPDKKPRNTSISEQCFLLAKRIPGFTVASRHATTLLAGILEQTANLREALNADTLDITSQLFKAGAQYDDAWTIVNPLPSLSLIQLIGRAAARSKIDEDRGVLWSFLAAEDFVKTGSLLRDLGKAADHLRRFMTSSNPVALVWQDPADSRLRAMIAGERALLDRMRTLAPSALQNTHLTFSDSYDSFQDAETRIASLLDQVL